MYLRKSYLPNTVGQTRLSCIVTMNIERTYANRIRQESMDRITDIFGKTKNCESL